MQQHTVGYKLIHYEFRIVALILDYGMEPCYLIAFIPFLKIQK